MKEMLTSKIILQKLIPIFIFAYFVLPASSQTMLEADGPGNTYELINSVLAPNGGDVVENPECVHPEFGRHITEVWDATLNQYAFAFHIHVTPDNDRCTNFDRQRMEIKTYDASPDNLKGVPGETVVYKWKFKIPTGFQPSSSFTHLHQIKAVGGDDDDPIFTLTARKGTPNKMELNYYQNSSLNSSKLATVNLSLFENTWVEVTERIKIDKVNGAYSINIKNISTGATILSYSNNNLLTIRVDNDFIRPKWGIYRSLINSQDLRDESLRFASFSIDEENFTNINNTTEADSDIFSITPNPVKNLATINLEVAERTNIKLELSNLDGQLIENHLNNTIINEGRHQYNIDTSKLENGIYIARLITNQYSRSIKMLVYK
ncbi:MAG: T9SS type A sorting domain-containing protein [Bacteroidales bacterium]|nr:T9SS type A sorting domain-containing protein [Bacteroidales bacterium]